MKTRESITETELYTGRPPQPERERRNSGVLVKGLGALGLAGMIAGGAMNQLTAAERAGGITDAPKDSSITELFIEDGAKLRSDAHVGNKDFSNQLDQVDLGDAEHIVLPTENGVHITSDENGTWYGVKADDLTSVLDVNVEDDEDGIIWINDDRAEAIPSSNIDLE